MRRGFMVPVGLLALVLVTSGVVTAQVASLFYKEVKKDGRIYVFNTPERLELWRESGAMGDAILLEERGPNGETIIAENQTAVDLYFFKHDLDAEAPPVPKTEPPPVTKPEVPPVPKAEPPPVTKPEPPPVPKAPAPPSYPATKIGGRVFADFTKKDLEDEGTGVKSSDSGVGVDVKRFYFTLRHDFDPVWSALFQSDIGDQGQRRYDVFVKQAYVQARLLPQATFRLGSASTPWIPFAEDVYRYRYLETTVTDRLGFGASADWGLHFLGSTAPGTLSYALGIENGRGFSNPSRSKSVDFEGRLAYSPVKGLTFGAGGYSGNRGLETDAMPARHTARRANALAAYGNDRWQLGGEWFQAKNWNTVTTVETDESDGFSVWGAVRLNKRFELFGRYDNANPSKDLKPALEDSYYNAGLQVVLNKALTAAVAFKHEETEGGTIVTTNGTVGSNVAGAKGTLNEIGVWILYDF